MLRPALLAAVLLATPALAAEPMSGAAFDAYTTGKTLFYGSAGAPYGAEQYLPGRRVIWTFLDGDCQRGVWFEQDGQICFIYDPTPDAVQCWHFYQNGGKLSAQFESDPSKAPLVEVEQSDKPLLCPAPNLGV